MNQMRHSFQPELMTSIVNQDEKVFDDGYFRIEHDNYYASCGGQYIRLTRIEFLFLSRLAQNPYRVIPVKELWNYVHERDNAPFNMQNLRVHIHRLRQLLKPFGLTIETVVQAGYRLVLNTNASDSIIKG